MARHFKEDPSAKKTTGRRFKKDEQSAAPQTKERETENEPLRVLTERDVRPEWHEPSRGHAILSSLVGILALLLAALVVVGIMLNHSLSLDANDREVKQSLAKESSSQDDPFYVLIVGSDKRIGNQAVRRDALMLARIDPATATVSLVSIPHSTMVNLPDGEGAVRLGSVYASQGAGDALTAVSEFAGVPINHFVKVDLTKLEHIIDTLGGVQVDVPEAVYVGDGEAHLEAGEQVLNGSIALAYAREYDNTTASSFGDAQAQKFKSVIAATVKQARSASLTSLPGLIANFASCVSTDYNLVDLAKLALLFRGKDVTFYNALCPSYQYWDNDINCVGTLLDEWQAMMRRIDAGLDPNDASAEIPEPQASDEELGAAANAAKPSN